MPSGFFPSSFRTLGPLLILLLSYANVFSQITIKERVAIEPKVQPKPQPMSIPSGPLLTLDGMTVKTTMPGVVITGSVSISPETIPNNTGYEVWVNVGGSSHMIRKEGTGYCQDTSAQESSPFPATLQSCGVIGMSATTFVPAPWQWSCAVRGTSPDTPQVSGNSATLKVNGTLWYTGFTATLTISASLDESYQVTQVIAEPQDSSLTCNGATAVDVTILDGHGNLYVPCGGTQLMGTATINAKGAYAFLEGNGQSAQTIDFAVNNGRGGFLVVLQKKDPPFRFVEVETCFDRTKGCFTQRVRYVAADIVYGLCLGVWTNENIKDISSANLESPDEACDIVDAFARIIKTIETEHMSLLAKYNSKKAVLAHEKKHADLLENLVRDFIQSTETELQKKCAKARTLAEAISILGSADKIDTELWHSFELIKERGVDSRETDAGNVEIVELQRLIDEIQARYGSCE